MPAQVKCRDFGNLWTFYFASLCILVLVHLRTSSSTSARLRGFSWQSLGAAWLPQPQSLPHTPKAPAAQRCGAGHPVFVLSQIRDGFSIVFQEAQAQTIQTVPFCLRIALSHRRALGCRGRTVYVQPAAVDFSPMGGSLESCASFPALVLRARPRSPAALCGQPRIPSRSEQRCQRCARLYCGCSAAALPHGAAKTPRHRRFISTAGSRYPYQRFPGP